MPNPPVITRFAPSPTGFLHIGGARTALFNWLFAKHHGGKFLLRIEDTDRARSTQAAIDAILDGMRWLGLEWDGEVVHQFSRAERHQEVARTLVDKGLAYRCYCTQEELSQMRAQAEKEGQQFRYDGRWRDRDAKDAPSGVAPAIRLKVPQAGEVTVDDQVQGEVTVAASQLEDLVIMRSDGTPTYNLAVVADDYDMGITHVIRGNDHMTNTAKQKLIYEAMGWQVPVFAHVPLIHGADGAKLSKRHGALGVDAYREMGYLPEALRNYLLRLGWAHGDEEIISTDQAIAWFSLEGVGKSPSRFDFVKLENLNGHYIREAEDTKLVELIIPILKKEVNLQVDESAKAQLKKGMPGLKQRAKTVKELAHNAAFYIMPRPLQLDEKAKKLLEGSGREIVSGIIPRFATLKQWDHKALEQLTRDFAQSTGQKLGEVAQPLRAALSGRAVSPGVFEVMEVLGKEESLERLRDVC